MCRINFKPGGVSVEVPAGTSIHEAIEQAGLSINLLCGGQGRCGRCKVIVEQGNVKRRSISRLTSTELEQGYALACQTMAEGDLTVFIPPQEQIERRVFTEQAAEKPITLPVKCDWQRNPWIRKCLVNMIPPTLGDNTTCFERLKRDLHQQHGIQDVVASLPVLQELAPTVRENNWRVTAVLEMGTWLDPDARPRLIDLVPGDHTVKCFGVAVDIGTTSNVVFLVDMLTGKLIGRAGEYNGQIACGEDVISRIIYAKRQGGREHLQRLVVQTINGLIEKLAEKHGIEVTDIAIMTVAGNTTMIHLFLGIYPEYIRLEPYVPALTHPLPIRAHEVGIHINPEATIDCLPCVGSYMGGDITAGVLSSGMYETEELTLFIDIGTNGEIVLGNSDWLLSCACSAGPAFEGAGVRAGMRATTGAIEDVWIDAKTFEPTYRTIGDQRPKGICGSGMISLLAEMFITGVVDKGGHINQTLSTPRTRAGEHGPEYVIAWAEETHTKNEDLVITEVDVSNLIRAKAAIYAGFTVLTRSVGLDMADVERVLIAGNFGQYVDIEKAIQIGLLPDMPWDRFQFLGNTSVLGAYTTLLCRDMRREVAEIANKMTYLELSADNSFMDEFTSALFLPHTDMTTFPSVIRLLRNSHRGKEESGIT
ncbi:MAG: ASKHA domain-containing protein [Chloroflexota bacterium]